MGMDIEVVNKVYYTVHLTDKDVEKVKQWLKDHEDDLPSYKIEENICAAVMELSSNCEIELFSNNKATESDSCTERIVWSEFEERTAEEILLG